MSGKFAGLALVIFLILLCPLAAVSYEVKPGLWETTTTFDMPGVAMQPMTQTVCVKAGEAKDYKPSADDPQCVISDQKFSGNKGTWTVKCKEATMYGEITYKGDTAYEAVMRTVIVEGGAQHQSIMRIKGRRIGNCQ